MSVFAFFVEMSFNALPTAVHLDGVGEMAHPGQRGGILGHCPAWAAVEKDPEETMLSLTQCCSFTSLRRTAIMANLVQEY